MSDDQPEPPKPKRARCPLCLRHVDLRHSVGYERFVPHGPGVDSFFCFGSGRIPVAAEEPCREEPKP